MAVDKLCIQPLLFSAGKDIRGAGMVGRKSSAVYRAVVRWRAVLREGGMSDRGTHSSEEHPNVAPLRFLFKLFLGGGDTLLYSCPLRIDLAME